MAGRSLLLVVHEYDEESLEDDYGVQVDPKGLIDGVPSWLALGCVNQLLHVVESEGAEEEEASIEPDVEEGLAGPENLSDRDSNQTCAAHTQHASPLEELLTWGVVGYQAEATHGESSSEQGIEDDGHACHVNQGDHAESHSAHE